MALTPVDVVQRPDKVSSSPGKKGGGTWGTIGGLVGGAALGATVAATGGAALPAIALAGAGGAATGASLGGLIGESIKPTMQATSSIERRLQSPGPQMIHSEASEQLKQSILALHQAPSDVQQQYAQPLVTAYLSSLAKDNTGGQA